MDLSRDLFFAAAGLWLQWLVVRRGPKWLCALLPAAGVGRVAILLAQGRAATDVGVLASAAFVVLALAMWWGLRHQRRIRL